MYKKMAGTDRHRPRIHTADSTTVKQRRETVTRRVKTLIVRTAAAGWIPAGLAHELLGLLRLREA
jgi:hypothetical protein